MWRAGSDDPPATPQEIPPGALYEGSPVHPGEWRGEDTHASAIRGPQHRNQCQLPPATALFVVQEEYLDEASGTLKIMESSRPTPERVKTFLKDSWDPTQEESENEKVGARGFLKLS